MISNGPLVIKTPYVVYVLCRVRPNARDEVKDEMCDDVLVTALTSALLISNRQIQGACVVLTSPSCLTLNLKHALSTMCFFLLPMLVMVQLGRLCAHLVDYVRCVDCLNYADFVDDL
jgi:hypothetical protein